jgi:hypothetical protein
VPFTAGLFPGDSDIPGANMSCGFQVFKAPVFLERRTAFPQGGGVSGFPRRKTARRVHSFDAEIEFFMGPTLNEMEKIVITKPTIIRIPKCMWHSPLDFKRMTKPVLFQAVSMHGKFGSIKLRKDKDGRNLYVYTGDEARSCVFDAAKTCNYCGKCFDRDATLENRGKIEQYLTVKEGPLSDSIKALSCELPAENTKWGDWCPTPQAYFRAKHICRVRIIMSDSSF